MQGADVLAIIAEIGAALAGFSGIVVALRQGSIERWSLAEVLRLRFMLYMSVFTFLFALLPFTPFYLGASPTFTWRLSSLALAIPFAGLLGLYATRARPAQTGLDARWWVGYMSVGLVLVVLLLANAVGFLGGPSFGLYLVGLAGLLVFTTTVFVRMVLAPFANHPRGDDG